MSKYAKEIKNIKQYFYNFPGIPARISEIPGNYRRKFST